MIKGLSMYEKYRVVRPVIGGCELDDQSMPIIRYPQTSKIDWENLRIVSFKNLLRVNNRSEVLAHMFSFDKELMPLWNHPLKRIPVFQSCSAIATPDFSLYSNMNINQIRHNVFMARWLGCTWQNYGCTVIPTVGWAESNSFDICFSGIERGTPVIISTIGCKNHISDFLLGYNEMRRRLDPCLTIVYGNMIPGMHGRFLHFPYASAFHSNAIQLRMDCVSNIFTC